MSETPSSVDVNNLIQTLSSTDDDDNESDSGTSSVNNKQGHRFTHPIFPFGDS